MSFATQGFAASQGFNLGGPSSTNFIFFPDGTPTRIYENDTCRPNLIGTSVGASASLFGVTGLRATGVLTFTLTIQFLDGSSRTQVIFLTPLQLFQGLILSLENVRAIFVSASSTVADDTSASVSFTINSFVVQLLPAPCS